MKKYLRELESELAEAGVRGRAARRALEEARDHLAELGEGGEARFGPPREIALETAAVLATSLTRRAALQAFGALALAGPGYLVLMAVVARQGWPDIAAGRVTALGVIAALGIVFLPQLAFVAGCLTALRALRLPRPAPDAQLRLLRRRAGVALVAGAGTLAAWALWGVQFGAELTAGWPGPTIVVLATVLMLPLGAAGLAVRAATHPRPLPGGEPGDMFDDLAPFIARTPLRSLDLRAHPWGVAFGVAVAVGLVATAVGWIDEGTPSGGLAQGFPEAVLVLGFFAAFGRTLGLRSG
ncbi:MAG: hypothetical protein ABR583_09000 [Gaiellaceae bacterium]